MNCSILISGASGIIGYGILKSLRQSHPNCHLIGTTVYEYSAAQYFSDVFEKAPFTDDENYIPWLLAVIKKYDVKILIPGIEIDVMFWNKNREKIEKSGAHILLNNSELIKLCADKWLFYQRLISYNLSCVIPTSLNFDEKKHKFPLLIKPRKSSGSKGISVVQNKESIKEHMKKIGPEIMIQPIIGTANEEYTTSAFFDNDSKLCAFMTLQRTLSQSGFTEYAKVVDIKGVEDTILQLAKVFMPVGPTNFQFRLHNGKLKLLEINPRISSATSLRTAFGYNESAMSVNMLLNGDTPSQPTIKPGHAVRYIEDLIHYDSSNF